MTKMPTTYTAGRADSTAHVHTTYEGTCQVYSPSAASPGASNYVPFSCGHTTHPDYLTAERCVEARAARHVARLNREAAAVQAALPCRYRTHEDTTFSDEPTLYMRVCDTHHRIAGTLLPDRALAEATEWVCPWQHVAGVADLAQA
jgi:hypothetical protein